MCLSFLPSLLGLKAPALVYLSSTPPFPTKPLQSIVMAVENTPNDAERGIAENVFTVDLPPPPPLMSEGPTRVNSSVDLKQTDPPSLSIVEKEKALDPEKKMDVAVTTKEKQQAPKKAPKFKFKRASRWVRFKLWYNTYRYAARHPCHLVISLIPCSGNSSPSL